MPISPNDSEQINYVYMSPTNEMSPTQSTLLNLMRIIYESLHVL